MRPKRAMRACACVAVALAALSVAGSAYALNPPATVPGARRRRERRPGSGRVDGRRRRAGRRSDARRDVRPRRRGREVDHQPAASTCIHARRRSPRAVAIGRRSACGSESGGPFSVDGRDHRVVLRGDPATAPVRRSQRAGNRNLDRRRHRQRACPAGEHAFGRRSVECRRSAGDRPDPGLHGDRHRRRRHGRISSAHRPVGDHPAVGCKLVVTRR